MQYTILTTPTRKAMASSNKEARTTIDTKKRRRK
jgi:hypothetical protein